jgi:hypothetical protein
LLISGGVLFATMVEALLVGNPDTSVAAANVRSRNNT